MAQSKRSFYRTVIPLEVLSEEPIPGSLNVGQIYGEAMSGSYSCRELDRTEKKIGGRAAARALEAQASDPGFFRLTPEGEDCDDLDDDEAVGPHSTGNPQCPAVHGGHCPIPGHNQHGQT